MNSNITHMLVYSEHLRPATISSIQNDGKMYIKIQIQTKIKKIASVNT